MVGYGIGWYLMILDGIVCYSVQYDGIGCSIEWGEDTGRSDSPSPNTYEIVHWPSTVQYVQIRK